MTLRMRLHRLAPKLTGRPDQQRVGVSHPGVGVDRHGKEHAERDDGHLDASPMPSHRISSGSSAIFGTGKVAAITGLPIASSTPKTPTARPTATPASAPSPKPSTIRFEAGDDVGGQLARAQHLEAAAQHRQRRGRNSGGTHPVRVSSSHSTTQTSQPHDARHRMLAPYQEPRAIGRRHAGSRGALAQGLASLRPDQRPDPLDGPEERRLAQHRPRREAGAAPRATIVHAPGPAGARARPRGRP